METELPAVVYQGQDRGVYHAEARVHGVVEEVVVLAGRVELDH